MKIFYLALLLPGLLLAEVTIKDTTIVWHTFDFTLNSDNTISWSTDTPYDTVTRTFSGMVIENEYLKVTLLPEYGGRILSMIYKPTGHEELYQNPAGAPYGIGEDWFYYKWLMVYGGIFPTMPEPEHGKAWFLPWRAEVMNQSADTVSIRMSWQDTVQLDGIDTGKWKYGITELKCDFTITLISGKRSLDTHIVLSNNSIENLDYEYWTCLTLAPGSEPGNPATTEGAEIIIPASKIKIPSWYPDIAGQEQPIPGQHGIYTFSTLRFWKNWPNDGIAYPWDDSDENYWGVINHDNEEGLIRVSENKITPGIKIWAWGYPQSQGINPFQYPDVVRRPYIELWAGHSNEFFEAAQIPAFSTKEWEARYVPTVGLKAVSHASEQIIIDYLINENDGTVNLAFIPTGSDEEVTVLMEITGSEPQVLKDEQIAVDPFNGNSLTLMLPARTQWLAEDSLKCTISGSDKSTYISESLPLESVVTGLIRGKKFTADNFHLYQNFPNPFNGTTLIPYSIDKPAHVTLTVYNALGETVATLVNENQAEGLYQIRWNSPVSSGIYYYRLEIQQQVHHFVDYKKMILIK